MTAYEILRLVVWAIGVPIIVWQVVRAVRQVRRIRAMHRRLLDEEATSVRNPYAELASLMDEPVRKIRQKR